LQASKQTFNLIAKITGFLAISTLLLAIIAMIIGDGLVLPWYSTPTYVKAPLFLEYFRINDQPFGLLADQVLVWQHFTTGNYTQPAWPDYLLFGAFFIGLVTISVTLTYLYRSWYLFCTGIMLLAIMQLNLSELGFLPDYIGYISLLVFGGSTYFFQSIKPKASLLLRTLSITVLYLATGVIIGFLAPIIMPISATIAFGLFTPLMLVVLVMLFVGGDTMSVLFNLATKSSEKGKNGLIHFMSIGLIYLTLVILLFLEQTGSIKLDVWVVNPYIVFIIGLVCGHLSLTAKLEIISTPLPSDLIKRWLYPSLAALSLSIITYAELTGNDSLTQVLEMCILATHLGGATVFFFYALINFTPQLLTDEKLPNFFAGFRAPLLTARVLQMVFIVGIFFYLDSQPFYQARAARYVALGALGESVDSDLLASQYYKQANFYDYYNFKANYALAKIALKEGNDAEVIDYLKLAVVREKETKATIALANYYSGNDQLFNKLLTLKKPQSPNYRLINNLGIAHFEFNHYDSSLMALDRSLELKTTEAAMGNKLALRYYTSSEALENVADMGIHVQINQQALANKMAFQPTINHQLSTDTLLYVEDLYYLYNHGLNRNNSEAAKLMQIYEYYLSNRRNIGQKDFLLMAYALQCYESGLVNKAIENMAELLIIDPRNKARHAFTLGLWAAQQQAYILADEYLDMAISGKYRMDEALSLKVAMTENTIPTPPREAFDMPTAKLNEAQLENYRNLAVQNAFDISLTLKVIETLKADGMGPSELYELLRQAITINPYSLKLVEAYAWQGIETGLAVQGRYALLALQGKVNEEELQSALTTFEQRLEAWRARPDQL